MSQCINSALLMHRVRASVSNEVLDSFSRNWPYAWQRIPPLWKAGTSRGDLKRPEIKCL